MWSNLAIGIGKIHYRLITNSDGLTCLVSFESAVLKESFDMNDSVSNSVLSVLMFLDIFLMVK